MVFSKKGKLHTEMGDGLAPFSNFSEAMIRDGRKVSQILLLF